MYNATILIQIIIVILPQCVVSLWWNLGLNTNVISSSYNLPEQNLPQFCSSLTGLTQGQSKLCELYTDHMSAVAKGAKIGIHECQFQFRNSQWNCSSVNNNTVFGTAVTKAASRESGFVHAITAAGVLQAISRSCRNGDISTCGCSNSKRPGNLNKDWVWGGCGDNVEYGYKFTKAFVDIAEKSLHEDRFSLMNKAKSMKSNNGQRYRILNRYRKSKGLAPHADIENRQQARTNFAMMRRSKAKRLTKLHNNEAGRRAVYGLVKIECKCHGVSGSCSMKTCWLKLPSFREVGDLIKQKYDSAIEVKYQARMKKLRPRYRRFVKPTKEDIIYIDDSPNYCTVNKQIGSLGTKGRQCNRNSYGPDSCNVMCCGRGYYIQKTIKEEKCKCKFQWCCSVKCETCITEVETYICK